MYKIKQEHCPVCNAIYTIKYSTLFQEPFAVIEVQDSCHHEHIIRERYVSIKIVKKNRGLT